MAAGRMRPFGEIISLEKARTIIDCTAEPIDRTETLPLHHANGRVLARDVVSPEDVPAFSRAAMDGYAVRAADLKGASRTEPRTLRRIEKIFTGQVAARDIHAGECIEIATGAPLPSGADAVVMVEETEDAPAETVRIFSEVKPQQNVGRRGADIQAGQTVLRAGETLNSSRLGALAAIGAATVEVYERPRVAILPTGNEVVEPGLKLQAGQVYDINRFTLSAVVSEHGGTAVPYPTAPDKLDDLVRALEDCLTNDIIVFSGGSSVGERDLVLDAISARGEVLFHGIAVKPGKPTAFGVVAGKPVFGMPGYPASCLTNAYVLLVPLLRRIAHLAPQQIRQTTLPLARRVVSAPGRHQFYTVQVVDGSAVPAFKASGDITSMSLADGYIEIPADVDAIEQGTLVDVKLF
jgi:molybdenum cofactor synthesis domain-containing protein